MTSRLSKGLLAWDRWFFRLRIDLPNGETVRRDGPAWLIKRFNVRGRLLLTDAALYYKSSSSVFTPNGQFDLRVPLADVEDAAVRTRIEWRAALPGLSAFELKAEGNTYVFQAGQSAAWVAVILSTREEGRPR